MKIKEHQISTRTKLLFTLTLVLLIPAIRIAHTRLVQCESKPHPGAHHAPIPGSSGDPADFGCKLLAPATAAEKLLDLATGLTILATLRSVLVDIHTRRQHRNNLQNFPIDPT